MSLEGCVDGGVIQSAARKMTTFGKPILLANSGPFWAISIEYSEGFGLYVAHQRVTVR